MQHVWHLLFRIIFLKFSIFFVLAVYFFGQLSGFPWYEYTKIGFSVLWRTFGMFTLSSGMNPGDTNIHWYNFRGCLFSFFLGKKLGEHLLRHMITRFNFIWICQNIFPSGCISSCMSTVTAWWLQLLCPYCDTYCQPVVWL